MIDALLKKFAEIAEIEFADVIIGSEIIEGKLRLYTIDGSFIDVWFSRRLEGRYAYHWERRHIDDTVYRWDNAKHEIWKSIKTFPDHFHECQDNNVSESMLPDTPENALRYVLDYVREFVYKNKSDLISGESIK
ncbi:MAG: DUF6516 family protein [Candidatus Methanoperedens sp.]|nr:DUF6516 family protein [Candidatus Methanoperedens sp.]MCZ7359317.1 DUF6516 family protein [Candidatus Methanoperedens sp.]